MATKELVRDLTFRSPNLETNGELFVFTEGVDSWMVMWDLASWHHFCSLVIAGILKIKCVTAYWRLLESVDRGWENSEEDSRSSEWEWVSHMKMSEQHPFYELHWSERKRVIPKLADKAYIVWICMQTAAETTCLQWVGGNVWGHKVKPYLYLWARVHCSFCRDKPE